jgi:hypothetical protein
MVIVTFVPEKIPDWFTLPKGLFPDFYKNTSFPKNFSPPKNKIFAGSAILPFNIEPVNGTNPLIASGFSHAEPNTRPFTGKQLEKRKSFRLISDDDWCNTNDGTNTNYWQTKRLLEYCQEHSIVILDYEAQKGIITPAMQKKMGEINQKVKQAGSKLALWAQGLVQAQELYMPSTGVANMESAKYWADKYQNPHTAANPMIANTAVPISMPFGYYLSEGKGDYLHKLMQAHETAKLINPNIISMPSVWIQQEHVDGYTQSEIDIKMSNGRYFHRKVKLQAPSPYVYGTALWGAVWDGWYHFEEGRIYTDDPDNASENDGYVNPPQKKYLGSNHFARYINKYYGFYNYVYLAIWQLSQPHIKSIIEEDTQWQIPEYKTNNNWRVGAEKLPSYAYIRKEPIVRFKYDKNDKKVLILAQNPYNTSFETVVIRDRNMGWETELKLEAGWPTIGTLHLK